VLDGVVDCETAAFFFLFFPFLFPVVAGAGAVAASIASTLFGAISPCSPVLIGSSGADASCVAAPGAE